MSLQTQIMDAMKSAMKSKDTVALEALRAVKSALLLAKTELLISIKSKKEKVINVKIFFMNLIYLTYIVHKFKNIFN